jgi:hypothetical protein
MVIIKKVSGQLANKLHFLAHFVANSKAHSYLLIITCFPEFHALFAPVNKDELKVIVTKKSIRSRIFNKVLNGIHLLTVKRKIKFPALVFHAIHESEINKVDYDTNSMEFVRLVKTKIVLPEGWIYRDHYNFEQHQNLIRKFFSPLPIFRVAIDHEIQLARQMGDIVIGVHIRRGDYADFNGGLWFYSNSIYKNKMEEVAKLFAGQQCVFIICSNEEINKEDFEGFKTVIKERPAIVDLYLLAECDYLLGPPSTYTEWASFYKNVPMCYIDTPDKEITLASFNRYFR